MGKESLQNKNKFQKLIRKIGRKEKNSLEDFYLSYGKLLYAAAFVITKSKHIADEIVNEVLFKIWQTASDLPIIKNPEGWLYTITTNCAKDKLKSEKAYSDIYGLDISVTGEEQILAEDKFFCYIAFLCEIEQQILIFRFIEDMSFDRIAKEMNMPLSTITSKYYRALDKIKNKKF